MKAGCGNEARPCFDQSSRQVRRSVPRCRVRSDRGLYRALCLESNAFRTDGVSSIFVACAVKPSMLACSAPSYRVRYFRSTIFNKFWRL